jgi:hypothetical protein
MAAREWWLWTVRRPIVEVMRLEIEFFVRSHDQPDGKTIRRNSGQFASENDAETYGLLKRPPEADSFRIWKDGALRKTVSIRSERDDA